MKPLPDIVQWPTGRLDFLGGAIVMGILNVTPDSFSDGGLYANTDTAVAHGIEMAAQGAAIIDIGAESTRPGSKSVPANEQIARAIPVLKALAAQINIPISIDTKDAIVAAAAIDAGASIINDISSMEDEKMAPLAAEKQVPLILMHKQGNPETMQAAPHYDDVVAEVIKYLMERAKEAEAAGIPKEHIFLDPGIGFGKTTFHNLQLLNRLDLLCGLGYRVLSGTSRKRFIGQITGVETAAERVMGTAATVAQSIEKGASIVRVHDVHEMVEVTKLSNAMKKPDRFQD
ncbi:MAG: dihydropteroate synthase [Planctomycetota bacterium]|jgi:dihydropteroate synthase